MKRMIIVYNPRSSQFGRVRDEVLAVSRKLRGWTVGKYEVIDTDVDDNARRLMGLLSDEDLVVAAGGDGTAAIALNGVMGTKARGVRLGVLPYGNFNDTARTFGNMSFAEIVEVAEGRGAREVWGLECLVNGKRWRYGLGYFTVGLFAEAAEAFDDEKHRKKLQSGRKGKMFSWGILVGWYFRNRRRRFIPRFKLNGWVMDGATTDYVALNGRSMAQVMRGGDWYLGRRGFVSTTGRLASFWRLFALMVRSVLVRVPGEMSRGDVLEFAEPGAVEIQAEGEYRKFDGVRRIELRKAERSVLAVIRERK